MALPERKNAALDPKVMKRLAVFRADQMVTPCLWNGKPAAVAFSNSEVAFASSGVMGNFAAGGFKDSQLQLTGAMRGTLEIYGATFEITFGSEADAAAFNDEFAAKRNRVTGPPMTVPLADDDVLISRCEFVGGAYLGIPQRAQVDLLFREDHLAIYSHPARENVGVLATIPFSDSLTLEISGPGKVTSGGGFAGGGFGLVGAAEGMAIAGILNALTTKSTIVTLITVADRAHEGFFVHTQTTPEDVRRTLSSAFVRIRQHHHPAPLRRAVPAGEELISRLERLSAVHSAGALTDREFSAAKATVLNS